MMKTVISLAAVVTVTSAAEMYQFVDPSSTELSAPSCAVKDDGDHPLIIIDGVTTPTGTKYFTITSTDATALETCIKAVVVDDKTVIRVDKADGCVSEDDEKVLVWTTGNCAIDALPYTAPCTKDQFCIHFADITKSCPVEEGKADGICAVPETVQVIKETATCIRSTNPDNNCLELFEGLYAAFYAAEECLVFDNEHIPNYWADLDIAGDKTIWVTATAGECDLEKMKIIADEYIAKVKPAEELKFAVEYDNYSIGSFEACQITETIDGKDKVVISCHSPDKDCELKCGVAIECENDKQCLDGLECRDEEEVPDLMIITADPIKTCQVASSNAFTAFAAPIIAAVIAVAFF